MCARACAGMSVCVLGAEETKGIVADNSPRVVKDKYLQIDESQQTPSRMNLNKIALQCTVLRLLKPEVESVVKTEKAGATPT